MTPIFFIAVLVIAIVLSTVFDEEYHKQIKKSLNAIARDDLDKSTIHARRAFDYAKDKFDDSDPRVLKAGCLLGASLVTSNPTKSFHLLERSCSQLSKLRTELSELDRRIFAVGLFSLIELHNNKNNFSDAELGCKLLISISQKEPSIQLEGYRTLRKLYTATKRQADADALLAEIHRLEAWVDT